MKLPDNCKIEKIPSKDPTRCSITAAHLDVEGKRLLATDGHRLVVLPVEVDEYDVSGPVPVEAIVAAHKAGKSQPCGEFMRCEEKTINVPDATGTHEFTRESVGPFPSVDMVIPKYTKGTDEGMMSIGLDAKLLLGIAEALGSKGPVELVFNPADKLAPFRVNCGTTGGFGVLMPVRV